MLCEILFVLGATTYDNSHGFNKYFVVKEKTTSHFHKPNYEFDLNDKYLFHIVNL